jgi:pyruvate/2-oxoglutarate dehydrogenase complex dihydrolipoamide dehydrogenase (E3) component
MPGLDALCGRRPRSRRAAQAADVPPARAARGREQDWSVTKLDTILWATGFRAAFAHLEPLKLKNELGGIRMHGTQFAAEPRIHLIGFGPSQSTAGANRAGRAAAPAISRQLSPVQR